MENPKGKSDLVKRLKEEQTVNCFLWLHLPIPVSIRILQRNRQNRPIDFIVESDIHRVRERDRNGISGLGC